jgi:hypothetical protein
MDLYFEFNDSAIGREFNSFQHPIPAKYCVRYCATALTGGPLVPWRLVSFADRVWQEDDTGIKFLKNRNGNPETTPVDMKEFFWVKLSSKEV